MGIVDSSNPAIAKRLSAHVRTGLLFSPCSLKNLIVVRHIKCLCQNAELT